MIRSESKTEPTYTFTEQELFAFMQCTHAMYFVELCSVTKSIPTPSQVKAAGEVSNGVCAQVKELGIQEWMYNPEVCRAELKAAMEAGKLSA